MAEDGDNSAVRMLMDHLASVKLAAEETEWRLKTEIKALEAALKSMEETQQETEDQLDMAKNTIHELKTQMSKKWRLEALDDWKALVNQLNADRSRLQNEVDGLKSENSRLLTEVRKLRGDTPEAPDAAGQTESGVSNLLALPPPHVVTELRGELASLRRHMGLLEVQKRETEMELQKLKRQVKDALVKDALGNGHGMLGGYLLQSFIGLLGGKTKNRYQKPAYTPVLSV